MDEFQAELRARAFVRDAPQSSAPVAMEPYLAVVGALLKVDDSLGPDEAGYTMSLGAKHLIVVNGNDRQERQRFTICHEIAHLVLGLESEHTQPQWKYDRRPPNEVCCDVFAAELLLPLSLFRPEVDKYDPAIQALELLREQFKSSLFAVGSRFAALTKEACAFVIAEQGAVKYSFRSTRLRAAKLWIPPGMPLPVGSIAHAQRAGLETPRAPLESSGAAWFDDEPDVTVYEDACYDLSRDRSMILVWCDLEEGVPTRRADTASTTWDRDGLDELTGQLSWNKRR